MFWLRRKKKPTEQDNVKTTVQQELQGGSYIEREVQSQLARIEADRKLKKKWDALPRKTRAKLIEHWLAKGERHDKK